MARRGRFGQRLNRRIRRSALLLSVVTAVLGGLAISALAWWALWLLLGAKTETPNQVDLTKIALSVTAGIGGAVALVVAYRRQRDNERGRFAELFGAAAKQLGDPDVAVRIAGVYAMAGVADEFGVRGRRQQCIDVLCGYLRLPYDPSEGANHLVSRKETRSGEPVSENDPGTAVERAYQIRQNDSEVRRTIVAVIVAHLRPSAETSWSSYNFDFDDAVLEDVDFRYAVFAGRHTHFRGAYFTGSRSANFEHVDFVGKHVTFHGATFDDAALFTGARFTGAAAEDLRLGRAGVSFYRTTFRRKVSFEGAEFAGPRTRFNNAVFSGEETNFSGARFAADETVFDGATFDGARARFDGAEFDGARISFAGARFYATRTSFDGARLGGKPRWRRPGTEVVDFSRAEYHGAVSFADARFVGGVTDFSGGDFFGEISFRRTRFAAQATRFDRPRAWVGVAVDWADDLTRLPAQLSPLPWPPVPAELPPVTAD
ncbi:pentapeptide repeat-containing protein [Nocardia blacklockiae]|uniref:pentapeptide repeat-containing protein n=1 Tax=Nocardia blacklockiae TaxID=480036 RepID=UPI001893748B|nr:pentapeptide repeat-containing protein [Nocardia blacklockiae]MBF6173937.1 pentapeptide repeat-containing protein [Nocardia blacklockiae]